MIGKRRGPAEYVADESTGEVIHASQIELPPGDYREHVGPARVLPWLPQHLALDPWDARQTTAWSEAVRTDERRRQEQ